MATFMTAASKPLFLEVAPHSKFSASWYTVPTQFVGQSRGRQMSEQLRLLHEDEFIPGIVELIWLAGVLLHTRGILIAKNASIISSTVARAGWNYGLSTSGENELVLQQWANDERYRQLAILPVRTLHEDR